MKNKRMRSSDKRERQNVRNVGSSKKSVMRRPLNGTNSLQE